MAIFNNDGTVTLTAAEYEELCNDSQFLNCLKNQGVDNWDGYEFAQDEFNNDD